MPSSILSLPPQTRTDFLDSLTDDEQLELLYDWRQWARPNQLPPDGEWWGWMLKAGRGFGKTRAALEAVREIVESKSLSTGRIIIAARTAADLRDTVIEGESGILAISHPKFYPHYEPSKRRLTWPNGAVANLLSADQPESFRGPQCELLYCDEVAAWQYPEALDMAFLGLRLGTSRVIFSTTPRRSATMKKLKSMGDRIKVTTGSTFDNKRHLAESFFKAIVDSYEGTTLGRQEIWGEDLEDNPDALWQRDDIKRYTGSLSFSRVCVGVDPHASTGETGIVVSALLTDGTGVVLEDLTTGGSPNTWASAAIAAYRKYNANAMVVEVNHGGDMVKTIIRTTPGGENINIVEVRASHSKQARAEPVHGLYEQGRVLHVGCHPQLEDEMTFWVPGTGMASPNRLDALVWGITWLFNLTPKQAAIPRISQL